jgi:DNA invertase Pin-like site-specific DNA recombinase
MDTMTVQEQPICISYSRYSSDAQIGGTSIERQTREAAAWARANGYRLDTELSFQDEVKSAWSGEHAKSGAFSELLGAVRAGRIPRGSAVYIEAFDRLSRQGIRKTTRLLEDIIEHGVDVVVKDQVYDASALDDPMAMIMLVIRATEAKVASDDKSRRVKAAWTQKRERATAKPLTKNGPAWLRLMDGAWDVIADRAETVRRIFDLALAGHGALAICKRLNDNKVPTLDAGRLRGPMPKSGVRAGDWRQSTVKHLLSYRAVIGEYVSGDRATTVPGYWPAIIDAGDVSRGAGGAGDQGGARAATRPSAKEHRCRAGGLRSVRAIDDADQEGQECEDVVRVRRGAIEGDRLWIWFCGG